MTEDNAIALKIGTQLQQEYIIEEVLGAGGFGITYRALDQYLNKQVVIKEFLPNEIALRQENTRVVPKSTADKDNFSWGMDKFLQEARTLV